MTTVTLQIPHPDFFDDVLQFLYTGASKVKGRQLEILIANCLELGVDYDVLRNLHGALNMELDGEDDWLSRF